MLPWTARHVHTTALMSPPNMLTPALTKKNKRLLQLVVSGHPALLAFFPPYYTSLITFLPLFRRTHPSKLKSIPAAEMLSRKPTRLPRSYPDNKATFTTARRTAPHKPSILNSRQWAVKTDRIIIPVVECCIGSKEGRSRAGNRKRTCDGGTLKCGRVNVLGHEGYGGL